MSEFQVQRTVHNNNEKIPINSYTPINLKITNSLGDSYYDLYNSVLRFTLGIVQSDDEQVGNISFFRNTAGIVDKSFVKLVFADMDDNIVYVESESCDNVGNTRNMISYIFDSDDFHRRQNNHSQFEVFPNDYPDRTIVEGDYVINKEKYGEFAVNMSFRNIIDLVNTPGKIRLQSLEMRLELCNLSDFINVTEPTTFKDIYIKKIESFVPVYRNVEYVDTPVVSNVNVTSRQYVIDDHKQFSCDYILAKKSRFIVFYFTESNKYTEVLKVRPNKIGIRIPGECNEIIDNDDYENDIYYNYLDLICNEYKELSLVNRYTYNSRLHFIVLPLGTITPHEDNTFFEFFFEFSKEDTETFSGKKKVTLNAIFIE